MEHAGREVKDASSGWLHPGSSYILCTVPCTKAPGWGGVVKYNTKLALLALPSVIFEPRFRGSVRNLVYSDQPGVSPRRQEMRQPRDIKCGDSPCDLTAMPREKVTRYPNQRNRSPSRATTGEKGLERTAVGSTTDEALQ
uniref:Uncharacterized protein n=1 Tax=Anopheles culicifacies TaxID=139723 RepID=A0A182MAU7_9DIPT